MKITKPNGSSFRRLTGIFLSVLALAVLVVGVVSNKTTHADDLPIVHVSGTLELSQAWTADNVYVIDNTVTVPDGVTLTLEAGTIIKVNTYSGIQVSDGGTLYAVGTSTNPITITSIKDDSMGGDTNSDGVSNGSTGDYAIAVTNTTGMVTEQYVTTEYAGIGFSLICNGGYTQGLNLTDNQFMSTVDIGNCNEQNIVIKRNHFEVSMHTPISLTGSDVSVITMSGIDKNTFTGSDQQKVIRIFASRLAAGKTWSVDATNGVVLEVNDFSIYGTANFGPGLIVKQDNSAHGPWVKDGGTMQVAGTAVSSVVFTSIKDDSIGGDSGGDGVTSGGAGDYTTAIDVDSGGDAEVVHAVIKYGNYSFGGCGTVTDSEIYSTMNLSCGGAKTGIERNQFNVAQSYAMNIYNTDVSGVVLDGANKNTFTGSGQHVAVYLYSATVPDGSSWSVSSSTGVILYVNSLHVQGDLSLDSGVVVKNDIYSSWANILVDGDGSIDAVGTLSAPVIFTSVYDDSVGGDSNGDGGYNTPAAGNYARAIIVDNGATANVSNAKFRYATYGFVVGGKANLSDVDMSDITYGITASSGSQTSYRGSFSNIGGRAISACNWTADCVVDAAYVDWGTANGPFATNPNDNKVCGQVTVTPWVNEADSDPHLFDVLNCDNSTKMSDAVSSAAAYYSIRIGQVQIDCSNGMQDACDAIQTATTCFNGARNVALSTSPWPLPDADTTAHIAAFDNVFLDGAATYMTSQESVSVTGSLLGFYNELVHVADTMATMANAYNLRSLSLTKV